MVGIAVGLSAVVVGLPVLLIALIGWGLTLDFYLACSCALDLIVYAEEGEL